MSVLTKTCKTCGIEKTMECFWKNARYKDGKENRCVDCTKIFLATRKESQKESQRKWREKNPNYMKEYSQSEKSKEYHRKYYSEHKVEYITRKQQWRKDNPERETQSRQRYKAENKDKVNGYHRKWKETKRTNDVGYKIVTNTSRRIRYELNTLLKGKKTKRTSELLGCSIEYLKTHLEALFEEGMSWDNYGKVWEIDHIIPCASWDFTNDFDNKCCWNYRNLQPLLKGKNRSKRAQYDIVDKERYTNEMKLVFTD